MMIFSLFIFVGVSFLVGAVDINDGINSNSTAAVDLFTLLIKSLSNAIPETIQGSVNLAYTCSKSDSVPNTFKTDSKGMPFIFCTEVNCIDPKKIQCTSNVTFDSCQGTKKWVNGFHERFVNGNNSIKVECCKYEDAINMRFLQKMEITPEKSFVREEIYENGKLVAFTVFNDVEMYANDRNETFYSISIYEMTCPNVTIFGDNFVRKSNTTEVEDNEISALKRLASSAREIGLKIKNTQPKPQSIFNEDSLLSYLASKYPNNNNNGDQYNGVIVGEVDPETQQIKWTSSRDIFSQPSNVPLTNSFARDPGFRSELLKFDPYIPKRNDYFNIKNPNNFNDENIVVKN